MTRVGGTAKPDLGYMAEFITYSVEVACALPAAPERRPDGDASPHVRNAIFESQLVHTRLLAEFFIKQPPQDVVAADYVEVGASGRKPDAYSKGRSADLLLRYWGLTSSEIVHFGVGRDPNLSNAGLAGESSSSDDEPWVVRSVSALVDVTTAFVDILRVQDSEHADTFGVSLDRGHASYLRWRDDPSVLGAWQ